VLAAFLAESEIIHCPAWRFCFSCRGGSCGTCRTRRVSGKVLYPNPPAVMPEDDMVLICCAVPAEDENGIQPLVLDL
jgi:hypothetical protein